MTQRRSKILCVAVSICVFATLGTACGGIEYRFGGAPARIRVRDPIKKCIRERSIVVRPAYAQFRSSERLIGIPNARITLITTHKGKGLTFYRGRQRLTAEQVLKLLNSPDLQAAYEGLYKDTIKKGRSQENTAGWLFLTGTVGTIASGALLIAAKTDEGFNKSLLGTSVGAAIVGSLFITIGSVLLNSGTKKKNTGKVYKTIFMSGDLLPDLEDAISNYNRAVEKQCQR